MTALFRAGISKLSGRRFTQGAAALLPASLLPTNALLAKEETSVITDVHCHVFNAHDLPA
ncbi:hypothetical protein FHT79_006093 [Rhizobium sp. BK212]|uniref:hypothetical protein n=1 Tax=Rhizobium sp. BK212 TaxID=2587074 RepID=UPI0016205760|nr:hypothetical protein [Rhizobium sp. BK212]MBB4218871.1 hypothetical protein [Rhizobium sp. BK212]